LLILQRQGEFEKRVTPSEITAANFLPSDALSFDFRTPIAEGVFRETLAKACFRDGKLLVVWVSALNGVMEADYGAVLRDIRDSFRLT
jgi:hypothetical protein